MIDIRKKLSDMSKEEYEEFISTEYPYNLKDHWINSLPYEFWKKSLEMNHITYNDIISKAISKYEKTKEKITIEEIEALINNSVRN